MLTELSMVEQRYLAVREVLDGAKVTDVATRYGVDRRSVHRWLVRYASEGLGALADRSSRPERCPHQMAPSIEARIVSLRKARSRMRNALLHEYVIVAVEGVTRTLKRAAISRSGQCAVSKIGVHVPPPESARHGLFPHQTGHYPDEASEFVRQRRPGRVGEEDLASPCFSRRPCR
jgi:transposase